MRDIQLDIYRALIMMYIVCIIHLQYWLGYIYEPIASLSLFEMPVIFFISGSAYSLHNTSLSISHFFRSRFCRVLLPYYLYAIVSFVLTIAYVWLSTGSLPPLHLMDISNILLAQSIPYMGFAWHIWFILPYMFIVLSFPCQNVLYKRIKNRYCYVLLCVVIFCIAVLIPIHHEAYNVFCEFLGYNIFFVLGWLFYKKVNRNRVSCVLIFMLLLIVGLYLVGVKWIPMQSHKFPIDIYYIIFGVCAICILSLICGRITFRSNTILDIWNQRGYSIYLYQNYVFIIVAWILTFFPPNFISNKFVVLLMILLLWGLSTGLSYLTYPLELFINKYVSKIWGK